MLTRTRVYLVEESDAKNAGYYVRLDDPEMPSELSFRDQKMKEYYIRQLRKLNVKIVSAEAAAQAARRRNRKQFRKITRRLWTTALDKASLLEVKDNNGNVVDYIICNESGMLHLNDQRLHQYLVERMKRAGVKISTAIDERENQKWLTIAQEDVANRSAS